MSHNLEHQKVHTRMVKEVLKAVARANNHPYQSVFTDFIAGHPEPPRESWRLNFLRKR
ncbi:hypothetical protein QMY51_04841 (plasmid) [Escherichia coli]|nr:hypothetical protein EC2866750_5054 [Escherichia coli 2866750]EMW00662.1 hypothetical protein EC2850750_4882 [Escherichia coli 2850750]EMW69272.1 hypothetical protein EC2756500_5138 [Escherichia coli 2756500]ENA58288.1 hypothetical protein EC179550_4604 [Escherichia coli 179550]WNT85952.1 hypothetical protein QMY51_04841 [Escherichia coli]